jgi:hypothetical protein
MKHTGVMLGGEEVYETMEARDTDACPRYSEQKDAEHVWICDKQKQRLHGILLFVTWPHGWNPSKWIQILWMLSILAYRVGDQA